MSKQHKSNGRGQAEGSRQNRFSAENQPIRRRRQRQRSDLASGIIDALRRVVTVNVGGVPTKMELHEALSMSTAQDLLKAPVDVRLKAFPVLSKLGLTELMTAQAKVDQERAELGAERDELARMRQAQRAMDEVGRMIADQWKIQWYGAAKSLIKMRDVCDCGACSGELATDIETLCATFESNVTADAEWEKTWQVVLKTLREAESDPDDEFSTGQLSHD